MFPSAYARKSFKATVTTTDGHRNRWETSVQLRKAKKEKMLMKRRDLGRHLATVTNNTTTSTQQGNATKIVDHDSTIARLVEILKGWDLNRTTVNLDIMTSIIRDARRMLTIDDPPISKLLQTGAHHYLVRILQGETDPSLLFEVVWVFTNLTASEHKAHLDAIWQSGVIYQLGRLCFNDNPNVREQAAWCIGNIAADSTERRNAIFHIEDVIRGVQNNLENPHNRSLLVTFAFATSNLVKGGNWEQIVRFFALLTSALANCVANKWPAKEILDLAWSVSYCTEGIDNEHLGLVMRTGIAETLVSILSSDQYTRARDVLQACVRALGNFAAGTDEQTTGVIEAGFLKIAPTLLESRFRGVRRETCWVLSNIAAGSKDQIHQVVRQRKMMSEVIRLASQGPHDVVQEAIYTIANIVTQGSEKDALVLVSLGVFEPFCFFLKKLREPKLTLEVLGAVKKLLEYNAITDLGYIRIFDELDGVESLESLQTHANKEVYNAVVYLIETFFESVEDEDQNIVPTAMDTTYEFGVDLPSKQLFPAEGNAATSPIRFSFGGSATINTGN